MKKLKLKDFKKPELLTREQLKKITGADGSFFQGTTWVSEFILCSGDTWFHNPNGSLVLWYAPDPVTSTGLCHYSPIG